MTSQPHASAHVLPAGQGPHYDWDNDQPFVKVGSAQTGGAYCLIEDNLKASFALGLHRHDHHAETFYILDGTLDFYLDGDWVKATPGMTLHVPAGVPHACRVAGDQPAKMLMVMQPSGFDLFLEALAALGPEDFADEAVMSALNEKYDIVPMGPLPPHPDD